MPVDPQAAVQITAFDWVPGFARGQVRDLRVRWALEEAGAPYAVRKLSAVAERPADYFEEQPFGQVPSYRDGTVRMFESGAIVLHIGEACETLLPADPAARALATTWVFAALNSVEPMIQQLGIIDLFHADADWARARRPEVETLVRTRLGRLSDHLSDRGFLEDRFTAGDLMMSTVLRILDHTSLVAERANLADYKRRCEARPAFGRALDAQLADLGERPPAMAT